MLFKKIMGTGLMICTACAINTAMADGLSLESKNIPTPIQVSCNGTQLPYELPSNSNINDIPWLLIALTVGSSATCDFYLDEPDHKKIGSAQFNLSSDNNEGEVTSTPLVDPTAYAVSVTPGLNAFFQSITVSIQKK